MRYEKNHMRLHVCMPHATCAWALVGPAMISTTRPRTIAQAQVERCRQTCLHMWFSS